MTATPPSNDRFPQDGQDRVRGVTVVIPVLNEEEAIAAVLERIPRGLVDDIIVADGGSNDRTVEIASANGARVLNLGRGYGLACMEGARAAGEGCQILVLYGRRWQRLSGGVAKARRSNPCRNL